MPLPWGKTAVAPIPALPMLAQTQRSNGSTALLGLGLGVRVRDRVRGRGKGRGRVGLGFRGRVALWMTMERPTIHILPREPGSGSYRIEAASSR